jgi:hypothetical protein
MPAPRPARPAIRRRRNRLHTAPQAGPARVFPTGGLEIFALRREAEARLGDAFDIREFHARILEDGALPLGALREHVEPWLSVNAKAPREWRWCDTAGRLRGAVERRRGARSRRRGLVAR